VLGRFSFFWRQARAFFYLKPPHYLAFVQAWLALAFVFGIGYYYMFRELYGNLHIVRLEMYGKTVFAVIFIFHVAFGNVHPVFLSGTSICLVFVVLYVLFLAHARRHEVKSQGSA
jgi:hypothetical protein